MIDLISRADAIDTVLTYFIPRSHTGERGEHEEDFVRTIFNALPSADAVQGEWRQISPARIYECSICNHNVLTDYIDTYNYCPNCGARMKPYKGGDTE